MARHLGRTSAKKHLIIASICLSMFRIAYAVPDNESTPDYNAFGIFKFAGSIDGSYNYLLRSNNFTSKIFDRTNDVEQNGFTLQQVTFNFTKEPPKGWGGIASLVLGRDAYGLDIAGMDPNAFGMKHFGYSIPQAYVRYKEELNTIKLGMMQSLSGIEQFDYPPNPNFSRSILYGYAQPGSHVGLRGLHKISEELHIIAGIGNGWNTAKQAYLPKMIEFGAHYAVLSGLSLMIDTYSGYQNLTDNRTSGPTYLRNVLDVFGTLEVTDKLNFSLNYDYGVQTRGALPNGTIIGHVAWQGIAGYVSYVINDQWQTAFRAEIFNDSDGYRTGVRQNWREATFSLAYTLQKNLQIRGETRHDFSNVNAFLNKSGINTSNNQQSYALDMLFQF